MKRTLMKMLVLLSLLLISVGSTVAYLTDTEQEVNVMTLGRVEIDLIEQERNSSGELVDFQDFHPLYPGYHPKGLNNVDDEGYWMNVRNAIDKVVTVKNTGKAPAYVRLWFAFEVTDEDNFLDEKLHLNRNDAHWEWYFLDDDEGDAVFLNLNGSRYAIAVATYPEILVSNATTPVSLRQVLLDSSATNDDYLKLGDKYSIFVVAQGMQTEGFDNAYHALNEGFGEAVLENHPFAGMKEEESSQQESSYTTLKLGSSGDAVASLVQELINQGFYTGKVTSIYTTAVKEAVKAFQEAHGLDADGIADSATQHALYGTVPNGEGDTSNLSFTIYPAEKIDWYTGGIQEMLPRGSNFKIHDVKTGIVWWAHRWAGSNHAEIEPLTQADTERLCDIYDVDNPQEIVDKNLYQRRPCLVTVENRTFACSLYGVPHNPDADTIANNGMDGVLCLFFTNSTSHADSVDASHEAAIEYAYQNAPNGQKNEESESLGYVQITGNGVFLRKSPGDVVITQLDKDTVWPIVGPSMEVDGVTWYHIEANGYVGYVHGSFAVPVSQHVCSFESVGYLTYSMEEHEIIYECKDCPWQQRKYVTEPHNYDSTGKCACGATQVPDNSADATPSQYFQYTKTSFSVTITDYIGGDVDVVIPSYIDDLPVTAIGRSAFNGCQIIASVDIPNSVQTIAGYAFYDCNNLTEINIPNGVTYIGEQAFTSCDKLSSIVLPETLQNIGSSAFYNCDALHTIVVPGSVKSISESAFVDCDNLVSVTLLEGITAIESGAFSNCRKLESINIPCSVTTLKGNAFSGCYSLKQIEVADEHDIFTSVDGVLFSKDKKILISFPAGKSTAYSIPENVVSIGEYAFIRCQSLVSVTMPDSITNIGNNAFYMCNKLNSIKMSGGLKIIGDYAFAECEELQSIELPNGVITIGSFAFSRCSNLISLNMPNGLTSISPSTFDGCTSLINIQIPDNVVTIGNCAFYGCTNLTSLELPKNLSTIGNQTFDSCTNLTYVEIPNDVTSIGYYTFRNCSNLANIHLPQSITSIGNDTFSGCEKLIASVYQNSYAHTYCANNGIEIELITE